MKNINSFLTKSFFLKSIFILSFFSFVFISSISYQNIVSISKSTKYLIHTSRIQIELEHLLSIIIAAESGQRGFIITRDSSFIKPFFDSYFEINKSYQILKQLTSEDAQQTKNLETIKQLIGARFNLLEVALAESTNTAFSNDAMAHLLLKGKDLMEQTHLQINKMIQLESTYFFQSQRKYDNQIFFTPLFNFIFLLFSLLLLILSYLKLNRDIIKFKFTNEQLIIGAALTKQAEQIGDFSTWQWDLSTNKLVYSENQYRLLGCEPNSFEPTIQNFLEFVHPDDKHIIIEGEKQVTINQRNPPAFFRVIRKDGEIRYFKSISRKLLDDLGKSILIGVNSDITEHHITSLAIEEKNRSLEQSNKELASFNHITSHDLQEPLRKIQIFISRINESDKEYLTKTGKDYFEKIQSSAKRMRLLIDDLLLFSRASKEEKSFEMQDLNVSLHNALQDLNETILEKNAIINSDQLPTAKVIPFQIEQLFFNLLSNSLKYSSVEVQPVISINCSVVNAADEEILKGILVNNFYKISITDNGIGFEQDQADNIFNLFQRLHSNYEFEGSGIGLSICKKIIENHEGLITAKGEVKKSSTFTFYLPI